MDEEQALGRALEKLIKSCSARSLPGYVTRPKLIVNNYPSLALLQWDRGEYKSR